MLSQIRGAPALHLAMEEKLSFFTEEIEFTLDNESVLSNWLHEIAAQYDASIEGINYIFCSDEYLLKLNQDYLSHDYYTDILTFPYSPASAKGLVSDIYISIDRVKENANTLGIDFEEELHRVMVHGILHLLGFDDHGDQNEKEMRAREEQALTLRKL